MSFSFNDKMSDSSSIFAFNADDSYIWYLWRNTQITFFNWWLAWDYVNICWDRAHTFKPNKIYFDISQVWDNWWAWYKLKIPLFNTDNWWNYYYPSSIIDAVIISDGTNWFTQSWLIEFEMPERYWNYWNLNWKSKWYSWQIVLENLWDTIIPMIANVNQWDYAVHIDSEWTEWDELNFEKIHNYLQTIDTSLSIKNVNQYFFNCWIHIKNWYFKSVSEQITFGRNFDMRLETGNVQYWELSNWKAINWCSIKFSCYNGDFWWLICYNYSKIYWLDYETIYEPWSDYNHWHWGWQLWNWYKQDINWLTINRMRSVAMWETNNVILAPKIIWTHIETPWAIMDWWITINYTQAIRWKWINHPEYVHRYDLSAINNWAYQTWSSWRCEYWPHYLVDCIFKEWLQKVSRQVYPWWQYLANERLYCTYSLIIQTTTNNWTPISDANVILKDKNWVELFNWTTSRDWYANKLNWTITTPDLTYIEDNVNNPFIAWTNTSNHQWMFYQELLMTSWNNKWVRKIVKPLNTIDTCYTHTPYLLDNVVWDWFIQVPYINAIINKVDLDSTSYYKTNIEEYQWPFTLTINKWDYKYSEILDIKAPVNKVIVLKKQKNIINTDLENLN